MKDDNHMAIKELHKLNEKLIKSLNDSINIEIKKIKNLNFKVNDEYYHKQLLKVLDMANDELRYKWDLYLYRDLVQLLQESKMYYLSIEMLPDKDGYYLAEPIQRIFMNTKLYITTKIILSNYNTLSINKWE